MNEEKGCSCGSCEHSRKHAQNDNHDANNHDETHTHAHGADCACKSDKAHSHGGCGCGHDHGASDESLVSIALRTLGAVVLVFAAPLFPFELSLIIFIAAYVLAGGKVVVSAVKNIIRGDFFDENFLMSIATIGAFAIGDFSEAVAVMIFYEIGELLQGLAVSRSRKNIEGLMDIRPEFAVLVKDGNEIKVEPENVKLGDIIRVRPGERIPLDCVVESGESAVDTSALTGESVPLDAVAGTSIYGGSVNLTGAITCKVTNEYATSTVQKILNLVSEASDKKAKAEKFITRFAKIYTPCVIAVALAIAFIPLLFGGDFSTWFYRGLIFLVVSCPCALVVSIPVSFMGGIGGAAKRGVLVKGGNILDSLQAPKVVVFDKTGTLTKGSFMVQSVIPASNVSEAELKSAAALCERSSNHPIARSVRNAVAENDSGETIISYEELSGFGVSAKTENGEYFAGNSRLMEKLDISNIIEAPRGATVLHIVKNKKYFGCITVADEIKQGAAEAIKALRTLGVEKCYMLTGDNEAVASSVSEIAGLDGYMAGLLPHEKVSAFEKLTEDSVGMSVFVGDGINDAPLLARADIGVAMGGLGSDAAIEAADVVLMTDDLIKLSSSIKIARFTRTIVWQNIVFAMGVKLCVMIVAALGAVPMWLAIFADVGVALIAVANSTRAILAKE